jgi:hypothetical protein
MKITIEDYGRGGEVQVRTDSKTIDTFPSTDKARKWIKKSGTPGTKYEVVAVKCRMTIEQE